MWYFILMNNSPEIPKIEAETYVPMNVKIPEFLKANAKEYAKYVGISLHNFVTQAISEKLASNSDVLREALLVRGEKISQALAEVTGILEVLDGPNKRETPTAEQVDSTVK